MILKCWNFILAENTDPHDPALLCEPPTYSTPVYALEKK